MQISKGFQKQQRSTELGELRSRANAMLPGLNATHEATMPLQLIKCTHKRQHRTEFARLAG
jgi:hypothetical protein